MGRKRREPKDEKEAKELDRLRKNQQRCRDRKLGLVDQYNQARARKELKRARASKNRIPHNRSPLIDCWRKMLELKERIDEKVLNQQKMLHAFNQVRLNLQDKTYMLSKAEQEHCELVSKRMNLIAKSLMELQQFIRVHITPLQTLQINRRNLARPANKK